MSGIANRLAGFIVVVAACAPATPDWSPGHAADPEAPVGAETPIAAVLRDDPPPPRPSDSGEHDHHRGPSSEAPMEPQASEGEHAH